MRMYKQHIIKLVAKFADTHVSKKELTHSVVSLFLVFLMLIGVTYSWFSYTREADVVSGALTVDVSSGLRVDLDGDFSGRIHLQNYTLAEASSIDGRNIFFPTTGGTRSNSNSMVYREGTVGDLESNKKYISKTITMSADAGETDVWFDYENCYLNVKSGDTTVNNDAIRVAFDFNDGREPIVFGNTRKKGQAVSDIDRSTGIAEFGQQNINCFKDFKYTSLGNGEIIHLKNGETKKITLTIWLEGTDSACKDEIAGNDLDVQIAFTSSWEQNTVIYFVDDTGTKWINDNEAVLTLFDNAARVEYPMTYDSTNKWWYTGEISEDVTNIIFKRYEYGSSIAAQQWEPSIRQSGQTIFTATNNKENSTTGSWSGSTIAYYRIYFKDNLGWKTSGDGNIYTYHWGSNYETEMPWPGTKMEAVEGKIGYYYADIPIDITGIVIGSGRGKPQTVDIHPAQINEFADPDGDGEDLRPVLITPNSIMSSGKNNITLSEYTG